MKSSVADGCRGQTWKRQRCRINCRLPPPISMIGEDVWADLKAELEILSKMLTVLIKGTIKRQ
jgi:hypothetical protein